MLMTTLQVASPPVTKPTFGAAPPFAPRPQPSALSATPILTQQIDAEEPEVIRYLTFVTCARMCLRLTGNGANARPTRSRHATSGPKRVVRRPFQRPSVRLTNFTRSTLASAHARSAKTSVFFRLHNVTLPRFADDFWKQRFGS